MNDKKISFFSPTLEAGGVERMRVHLANFFATSGYDVDLVLAQSEGQFLQNVENDVNIVDLNSNLLPGTSIAASAFDLIAYLRGTQPDVFVSSMNHVNVVSLPMLKMANVDTEILVSDHNPPSKTGGNKQKVVNQLASCTYDWADYIVAVSEGVATDMVETYSLERSDISVIHNPVVTDEIYKKMDEPVDHPWIQNQNHQVILGVGRFHRQKNFKMLIRAFDIISRENHNAKLLMLGDGEQRDQLENLVSDLELTEDVRFLGYVNNPYKYMKRASAFGLPSRWEGFGNVIVEALACGCPVVATDCPTGPREILCDGQYGPLVSVGDEREMAEKLLGILDDPLDSKKLQKRAEDFTVESISSKYEKLLFG